MVILEQGAQKIIKRSMEQRKILKKKEQGARRKSWSEKK